MATTERFGKKFVEATVVGDSVAEVEEGIAAYLGRYPSWRYLSRIEQEPKSLGARGMYYARIRRWGTPQAGVRKRDYSKKPY